VILPTAVKTKASQTEGVYQDQVIYRKQRGVRVSPILTASDITYCGQDQGVAKFKQRGAIKTRSFIANRGGFGYPLSPLPVILPTVVKTSASQTEGVCEDQFANTEWDGAMDQDLPKVE
jgi:hypothetical protein